MTLLWLLTIAALCIAFLAVLRARRASARVERLTESYWEIRYEVAQLRSRVTRLEVPAAEDSAGTDAPAGSQPTVFVPLSSLKRS